MKVPGTYDQPRARIWRGPIPGTHKPGFTESPIIEDTHGSKVMHDSLGLDVHVFRMGDCSIVLGHEPGGVHGETRWHMTISTPIRHPSWDEIKTARYRLLGPDTVMAIVLPQPRFYVKVPEQDHVFQLWQVDDDSRFWETG